MTYIYLHGFASGPESTKAWLFRRRFAAEGRELCVPDLAAGDFEHLTITSQLSVLEREAAGKPAVLIGSSMGGYVAALYAARHPEVVRLLLLAPAFGFVRRWPETMEAGATAEWRRTGWLSVYHYGDRRTRRISYGLVDDALGYEDFPDVRQPVLIFHGTRDAVVPARHSEEFARAGTNRVLRLVESGHELVDVFDQIWEESRAFLFLD